MALRDNKRIKASPATGQQNAPVRNAGNTLSNTTIPQTAQGVNSNSMQNGENNSEKFSARDSEYLELAKDPEKNRDKLQEMVDEAAEEAFVNSSKKFKAQKNTANENSGRGSANGKFSLREITDENGVDYGTGVYLDSTLLTNLTDSERIQMVKEYVKELSGKEFTAYDNKGNAVNIKIAKQTDKFINKKGKQVPVNKDLSTKYNKNKTKQESVALIDELVVTARNPQTNPARYSHNWLDNSGKNDWEYWTTYLEDKENTIWEATLNVANSTNGEKILYDISPIKKVGRSVESDTTTTNNNITDFSENVNSENKKFSTRDAEYLELAKEPEQNEARLREMVEEAAEEAFKDSKVRDEDGKLLIVYHGTTEQFTVFDKTKGRANMDIQGMFFSPWEVDARGYGENVRKFYLNITNPASESVGYKALNMFKGQNEAGIKARNYLETLNYDGVNNESEEFIAFNSNQIKSADPVTYDDDGNIIPLSERFNDKENDIRFSSWKQRIFS